MIAFVAIMEALLIFPKTYSKKWVFQHLIGSHANFLHNFVNGVICHQEQKLQISKKRRSLKKTNNGRKSKNRKDNILLYIGV